MLCLASSHILWPLSFSPSQARNMPIWLPSQDEPLPSSNCAIRVGDKGWWFELAGPQLHPVIVTSVSPISSDSLSSLGADGEPVEAACCTPSLCQALCVHPGFSTGTLTFCCIPAPSHPGREQPPVRQHLLIFPCSFLRHLPAGPLSAEPAAACDGLRQGGDGCTSPMRGLDQGASAGEGQLSRG